MAINVEVAQFTKLGTVPGGFHGDYPEYPYLSFTNVSAAGEVAVGSTTRFILIRNRAGGDSVYVKVRAAGTDAAAADDGHLVAAGGELRAAIPKTQATGGYEVDIRAIV